MDFSVDLSKEAEEKLAQLPELKKIRLALMLEDIVNKYIEVESDEIAKRKAKHNLLQNLLSEETIGPFTPA